MTRWLVIGISGVTCSGKTTLAEKLHEHFDNSVHLNQDCYFLPSDDPRHIHDKELNHHNWDVITSLNMEQMYADIKKSLDSSDNTINKSARKKIHSDVRILIIDGFLIFDYKPLVELCHLKYFVTLTKQECWKRREIRLYDPPDVPGYFEKIVWPEYLNHKRRIEDDENLASLIFIDGHSSIEELFQKILCDITTKIQNL